MKPTNRIERVWAMLTGTRLAVACLGLLILFSALGGGAYTQILRYLRLSGLGDAPNSFGFICVLAVLALNLFCRMVSDLPEAWAEATHVAAPALPEAKGAANSAAKDADAKNLLRSEFETDLGKDEFATLAKKWGKTRLGRTPASQTVSDGLRLAVKRGRYHSLLRLLAHLALGFCFVGLALLHSRGFQARILIEEGARGRGLELLRGTPPETWKHHESEPGNAQSGYWDAGFEIEHVLVSERADRKMSVLQFYEEGHRVGGVSLEPGHPVLFKGWMLHLLDYASGATQSVSLTATDRSTGQVRSFSGLSPGKNTDLEKFRFKVLAIQLPTEINGPAVQLEYQERGKPPEALWIFKDFADYDFAHRKNSSQHFTLEALKQREAAMILIGEEPGAIWLWGGLLLMALFFLLAIADPEERYWIHWIPSRVEGTRHKVEWIGWSPRPLLFEPRFYLLAESLAQRLEKAEANDGSA